MKTTKKIKLLILLLLLCSTIIFIYYKTNKNNVTYINIGDSLAVGIDSYGQIDYGYSDYLKDYLKENNKLKVYSNKYTSTNMTIEKLINTILTGQKKDTKDINSNLKQLLCQANYLTMTIGINDLLYNLETTNDYSDENLNNIIKEIEENFNKLIKEISKSYRHKIYVIGYYDIDNNDIFMKKAIKKLNNIYYNNENVIYIPTYIISENKNLFLPNPNSYYPNYKGYKAIYSKIVAKMKK